jgi:hypothetical protein
MTNEELNKLGNQIIEYCKKFNVPIEYLFEILEDQKVTPMIRGKAMEYNAYLLLESNLVRTAWSVQKLNLNAQTGHYDEDISITHRRTGIILKVESKSSVRGSISDGKRSRVLPEPHFKVKCHRSRSNIELASTSNDRYSIDSFDLLITNPSNAIFQGNTVGEQLEIIYDPKLKSLLYNHYSVNNDESLKEICEKDWLFAIPSDIAENGYITRTPFVKLQNDANWFKIDKLEEKLLQVIEEKRKKLNQNTRRT